MRTHIKKVYACFPGEKHKALTMSYDDGKHEDKRLVALFNKHGIRGTLNLNGGLEGDPVRIPQAEYRELYKGHEVACHTILHPTIARCPLTSVAREVIDDRIRPEQLTNNDNWNVIEEFCELVGGCDDIWYATNIQIVDYMDVVKMAQFAADNSFVYNPCVQSLF